MANIYISLHDDDHLPPQANALRVDSGQWFINIQFNDGLTVNLHGYNYVAVAQALALAEAIRQAAEGLQRTLQEEASAAVVQ